MPCHLKYKRFTHLFEICDVGNQKTKLWNDKDIFRSLDPAGTCPLGFDGLRCGCHSLLLRMDLVPFQLLSYFSPIHFYHISVLYVHYMHYMDLNAFQHLSHVSVYSLSTNATKFTFDV